MKIKEINSKSFGAWLVAKIIDKSPTREIEKFNKLLYVSDTIIEDDTGKIKLSLWNDQIQEFNVGDTIQVNHVSVSEWKGVLQLSSKDITKLDDYISDEDIDKKYHVVNLK